MKTLVILAVGATAALTLSACGSNTPAPAATPQAPSGGGSTGLHVASTSLGNVLVDSSGRTVYMLTADSPGHSSCSSACLAYWPPVAPAGHASTVTAKVGSTTTSGGAKIATAGGWPLYTFVQDQKAGDVTGEGVATFGGTWYAVSPSGKPVTGATPGSSSSPSSSSAAPQGHGY